MEVINLDNFDDPQYKKSQYVLTSPRSLQVCANLGIKPLELLPQSFQEFRKSQAGVGLQGSILVAVYEEYEKQKRIKLHKARKERQKLLQPQTVQLNRDTLTTMPQQSSLNKQSQRDSPSRVDLMKTVKPTAEVMMTQLPKKDQRIIAALEMKRKSLQQIQTEVGEKWRDVVLLTDTEEEPQSLMTEAQLQRHRRASVNRDISNEMKLFKLKTKNYAEQVRFRRSQSAIAEERRSEDEYLKQSLKIKNTEANTRLELQASLREKEQKQSKERRRAREQQRKLTADIIAAELEEWRQSVDELSRNNAMRATQTNQQLLFNKVSQLQQKRLKKEFEHAQNLRKLQEEEKEIRHTTAQQISQKYKRIEDFKRYKADQLSQSLETAHLSARIRESMKDSYSYHSFDQLVHYAEQRAALEKRDESRKCLDPLRHHSKVYLG